MSQSYKLFPNYPSKGMLKSFCFVLTIHKQFGAYCQKLYLCVKITISMKASIINQVQTMTIDELRTRLVYYMNNDLRLLPRLVAIEVRARQTGDTRCRYDVLLIDEEGGETPVKFPDRGSRLLYVYTLLRPQGYQRRTAEADDCHALRQLYSQLYFKEGADLLKTIASTGFDHFFSQCVAQSRKALREASPLAADFAIDRPQAHGGKVLIPFVARGGNVIIDASLRSNSHNSKYPYTYVSEW